MRILELAGTERAMGEAFGESCREETRALYALRVENALRQARLYGTREVGEDELLRLAARSLSITDAYDASGTAELRGIARGAGLRAEQVLALQGLTDLRDALAFGDASEWHGGCTSALVPAPCSRTGAPLFAQTWDLGTENQPYVLVVKRRPEIGAPTWALTTVGCLTLVGWSEAGHGVGTTNLRTRDARAGVPYLSVLHAALRAPDARAAVARVEAAPRAGGHYYAVFSAEEAWAIECSAETARVRSVSTTPHVECNHVRDAELAALEADTPLASSRHRQGRMEQLVSGPELDARALRSFLADREGGELAIRRDDYDGISTNAAAVLDPAAPAFHACHGLPGPGRWRELLAGAGDP